MGSRDLEMALMTWRQHPTVQWVRLQALPNGELAMVCDVCKQAINASTSAQAAAFMQAHAQHTAAPTHYGIGDAVARATKALGVKTCPPCEMRRRKMNNFLPRVKFRG
jgi:hypothetical protein